MSGTSGAGIPTTTTAAPTTVPPTTTVPAPPPPRPAYDLLESSGAIHPFGGAFSTKKTIAKLPAPIVGGTPTPDGAGYWLVAKNGSVFNFGAARFEGSAVHEHVDDVIGIAATTDDEGYWVATSTGAVYAYGNAAYCGAANTRPRAGTVVAIVAAPDGAGYWLATSAGAIYNFGSARFYGSGIHVHAAAPVVAMATTPDGKGYWLAYANGSIRNFGDARFFGSAVHVRLSAPVVSMAATPDGGGYWLTGSTGRMANYGDAPFYGSLAHSPPVRPSKVVAVLGTRFYTRPTVSPFVHGALGYDISNFQCAHKGSSLAKAALPTQAAVEVLEVVGWMEGAQNSCLAAEAQWATRIAGPRGTPYNLYIFMNSPGTGATSLQMEATGPAGTCATLVPNARAACGAYNYGYNGARDALDYAASQGVHSSIWWLDVEGPNQYWSGSPLLNDQTIQGAIDAVRRAGNVAGLYSTSVQYPKIAGPYVPRGPRVPLWIAGAPWTNPPYTERGLPGSAVLAAWCAGKAGYAGLTTTDLFAGGVPWLLQETPGSLPSPNGLDPDYAC